MGALANIDLVKKDYIDREDEQTEAREQDIRDILKFEEQLGIRIHTNLTLRKYYRDQTIIILNNLKGKLKERQSLNVDICENESYGRH